MKFGLFGSAQARRGGPDLDSGQGFQRFHRIQRRGRGARLRLRPSWSSTISPASARCRRVLNLLTWVAARTKTLRLGTAVMVLPWHNPVLLAEQAATIDLLSGGRLDFGVGKGYRHNEFASFCIPMEEADERFEESLALIVKSWTSKERFSHHGKYWNFENIIVEPPTRAEAASADLDGGRQPGLDPQGGAARLQAAARPARLDRARDRALQHLQGRGRGLRPHVRSDGCRRVPRVLRGQERRGQGQGGRGAARQPAAAGQARGRCRAAATKSSMLSFDQTLDAAGESAMYGTPDEIAAKLDTLRAAGVEHVLLNGPAGSRENLRAFARDVMPAFAGSSERRAPPAASRPALVQSVMHPRIPPQARAYTCPRAASALRCALERDGRRPRAARALVSVGSLTLVVDGHAGQDPRRPHPDHRNPVLPVGDRLLLRAAGIHARSARAAAHRAARHAFVRGAVGTLGNVLFFWTLTHMLLADAMALQFSRPLFMIPLAIAMLGEIVGWRRSIVTVAGFLGIVVYARPFTAGFDPNVLRRRRRRAGRRAGRDLHQAAVRPRSQRRSSCSTTRSGPRSLSLDSDAPGCRVTPTWRRAVRCWWRSGFSASSANG